MSGTNDEWAAFRTGGTTEPPKPTEDPWAAFRVPGAKPEDPARAETRAANGTFRGMLGGAQRAVEQGYTFGLRDEAQAGMEGAITSGLTGVRNLLHGQAPAFGDTFSKTYDDALGRERKQSKEFAEDHPVIAGAGNLVGGVVVPGAMGGNVIRGAGVLPAIGRGMVAGGTGGAAAGFGEGEGGFEERAKGALLGGGLGAAGGGALPVLAHAATGLGGKLLNVAGLRNPETAAERQILRALERDNKPLADVAAEAAAPQGGAPLALADMGGRNTTTLGAVAANVPGRSAEVADALVQGRRMGAPDRLAAASDRAFGGGSGPTVAARNAALDAERKANAKPLYDAVRAHGEVDDPQVRDALMTLPDNVFSKAGTFARLQGREPANLIGHGENGRELARLPTTSDLDDIQRALGDSIEAAQRAGDKSLARELTIAKQGLVARLDDIIVDPNTGQRIYADARAAYAGPSQQLEAIEEGRTALKTDRDAVAETMRTSAPDVQAAYRLGAGRQLTDMGSDPRNTPGVIRKMVEDRQMQQRLESLLPKTDREVLADTLKGEVRVNAGNAAYSPRAGSQTARLQAGMDDMGADAPGGLVMGLLNATKGGGLTGAAAKGLEHLYRRGQGINSNTADALAERLFQADPVKNAAIVKALTERQGKDALSAQQRAALAERLLFGAGTAAGIAAN